MVRWGRLNKIIVHKVYIYNFSMAIGPHVYDSWNITKQKEIEKIMQSSFIKSHYFLYGSDFFMKRRYYCAFTIKNAKIHCFWMKFHPKTLNSKFS